MSDRARPERKALGLWMCIALVMGNIIGSGVFLLPAALAPYGWNALPGWGVTIGGAVCLAMVIARLARAMPEAGGPHGFVLAAFGELPAFLVMWSYWISIWVANAAIAVAAVSYLSRFAPGLAADPSAAAGLAIGLLWVFTGINILGTRTAGATQVAATALKILPLIAVVFVAAIVVGRGETGAVPPLAAGDISAGGIAATAALTLWAMLGLESAAVPSAKVEDPARTIPRATLIGTIGAGVIYLFACTAVSLLLPAAEAARSAAPFADFVGRYANEGWADWVALFAAIGALGALNGWVLLQGEVPLTLARAGVFPRWFGVTNAAGTPLRALIAGSALTTTLIAANYSRSMTELFTFMALIATVATLFLYVACAAAALHLTASGRLMASPGLVALTITGLVYALWAFYGAGFEASAWGFVLFATGLPVWAAIQRINRLIVRPNRAAEHASAALPE